MGSFRFVSLGFALLAPSEGGGLSDTYRRLTLPMPISIYPLVADGCLNVLLECFQVPIRAVWKSAHTLTLRSSDLSYRLKLFLTACRKEVVFLLPLAAGEPKLVPPSRLAALTV